MTINDIHSLIGPYALDALDADERTRFEEHLDHCADCRTELTGFLATSTRLGDSTPVAPPVELKRRLMAQVARTPQERPIVTALSGRSRLRRTLPRLAVAAATVVALSGLGAFAVEHRRNDDLHATQDTLIRVLTAADAKTSEGSLATSGDVRMISSKSRGLAVILTSDLPNLHGKTYQLWTIHDGRARSEGLLGPASSMRLVKNTSHAETIAITIEPTGGSKSPTTPPIATMAI